MKQCKKEKEQLVNEDDKLFLQRLRDENNVLNKLIKQLEERSPSMPKLSGKLKNEG